MLFVALFLAQLAAAETVSIPDDLDRVWIGNRTFANRLADWRLRDGRIECVEADPGAPVRTLALLDRWADGVGPAVELSVRTGPIDADGFEARPEAWTGFLIGAGGEHVDPRLSALVHLRPAEDGGLLGVLTGDGRLAFRDFSRPATGGGLWSLRGPLDLATLPTLPSESTGRVPDDALRHGVTLTLRARPQRPDDPRNGPWRLELEASSAGRTLARAICARVPLDRVDGSTALVSHLGPLGSERGHWFDDWTTRGLRADDTRRFGPILAVQYTVSDGALRLTAQFPPLGPDDVRTAELLLRPVFRRGHGPPVHVAADWDRTLEAAIEPDSFTATFELPALDALNAVSPGSEQRYPIDGIRYWVHWAGRPAHGYGGRIHTGPAAGEPFTLAAFTGHKCYTGGLRWNSNGLWFPHADVARAIRHHDPDLLFFSGDQIYEGDLTPAVTRPEEAALLDYHYKWQRWCWAFRDLTRNRPTITIPDDHDVYHGNIWGAGNVAAEPDERGLSVQDRGGYKMSARFVNAVHRTQVGHLPDPADPEPLPGGITTYHTAVEFGGVSFAVLADRMFKSSPSVAVPAGEFENGWPQAAGFEPARDADVPGARLLGERQLAFLDRWAEDWSGGDWMKVCLSQTLFANVATLPAGATSGSVLPGLAIPGPDEYPAGYELAADADSNGWPQTGRNRALRALRKSFALHVAGDQHLASTIQYGVDEWRDAGFALCVPSIANTWPRRWFPSRPGSNRAPGAPRYAGDFEDGFGNKLTVHAVANPSTTGVEPALLHDRAPGYGIVELDPATRTIELSCWPRWVDPGAPDARPYAGWPVRASQLANGGYERPGGWWLPELRFTDAVDPVVRVRASDGAIVAALRVAGSTFRARVPAAGTYAIEVLDGASGERTRRVEDLVASQGRSTPVDVPGPPR